ncbi:hypothetical protein FHG64_17375 [Antarcticibacterium flavum]|uniref:HEAT repeat domain-containing protein n=1 Tax=Antarcticibacterium flavum TaxID=2058175 RepID=A0A5B7X8P2_9FLAO|nr:MULTISPECIES: hypothetical protein [Antarcticibacterium]MCM4159265.1 hypothetical protein [Antarcticibacterium sp. W02-3]QCY71023.1 hypothetical protein FHG64_17375 [Antarcticibacterium flavum]
MVASTLVLLIKLLLAFLLGTWLIIGISLVYRKRRTAHLQKLETAFARVTASYLYPLPGEPFDLIEANRSFRKLGIRPSKPRNVQYLVDLMIRTQRSLLGKNYHKLEILYSQIPPYRVSVNKLRSKMWYVKAMGIREIYEMGQKQYIKEITKERNHPNIYVRRESQIAMVVFLGWKSLRFLPYLKREMTLWQQIKVVEKLHDLYPIANLTYLRKGYDSDRPYANELLMRIIRKFDLSSEIGYILKFIDSEKFDTRETAIYCISSFTLNDLQLDLLKSRFFNIPNFEQQVQLLKYIDRTSKNIDLDFFKKLLYEGNDIIKLSTAEILWNHGYIEEVQDFYYRQYDVQPQPA